MDTTKLLPTVTIEDEELSTSSEVTKLSEIYWKDYLEELDLNKDVNKMCEICIAEQIEKYGSQTIPCKGLLTLKDQVGEANYELVKEYSTQDEVNTLQSVLNAYDFMEYNCDTQAEKPEDRAFQGRWYQRHLLYCSAKSKVVRMGRRTGKALDVNTPIPTPTGWKTMGDLQVGDQVFDEAGHPTNVTFVTEYQYGRDCYELVFANGDTVIADGEHQWEVSTVYDRRVSAKTNKLVTRTLTTNEIITLREKHPKRKISIELTKPVNYVTKELPVDPYILGYWLGDGTSNEGQFTIGDEDIEEVSQLFLERDITLHKTTIKYRYSTRGLRTQLRELGVINNKHIPAIYLQASIEQRLELLRGLLDSDGHFQTRDKVVEFCTCFPELAYNFKELVSSLGIKTTHKTNSSSLYGQRKKDRHRFSFVTNLKVFNLTRKDKNSKSLTSYKKIAMYIKDINPVATRPVKCISVDSKNSLYLATKNYIVTHNTMSLAMQIIFKCETDTGKDGAGHRALLVSPFQSQTEEVIDNIKKLCSMLDVNPIASSKASPIHVIKFKNGSILKGFTAATNGDSIRGQPADSIWLDELDDIPAKAITSISGVFMDNPNVEFWRSGTPKGELNLFNASQDSQTKEFHYPSFVIPHYSDEIDRQIRADMDEVGYIQEALALYGVNAAGIFQLPLIERAQNKPKKITALDVMESRNSFIVILGVDWNHDQVGTRIVVTAYDKNDPQFYIIDKERISVEGWTQQIAIDKIISLNRKYNCDHVFVDNGFGSTQIGDLRLFGEMQAGKVPKGHPDLKLLDVQPVDFGSSVEIKDPTSGESFKQGLKQFAVQNAVQILEKDLLTLDAKEDLDLIKQMKNYIQKSRNQGRVTYGYVSKKIGDHDLDAMMIAFYGFKKLYSSILGGAIETAMLRFGSYSSFNKAEDKLSNRSGVYGDEAMPSLSFSSKKAGLAKPGNNVLQLYGKNKPKRFNNTAINFR